MRDTKKASKLREIYLISGENISLLISPERGSEEIVKGEVAFDVADYDQVRDKKEIKSEVENALIRDGRLNLFSLDKIPQLRNSDIAKYWMSFICSPNNCFASSQKSLNYRHPRLFYSSATPSLTLSPRSKQSSSVNVESSSILSNLLRSNSLASLSLTTDLWTEWIDLSWKTYNVIYTVKNVGDIETPCECWTNFTELNGKWRDCVDPVPIPAGLDVGESVTHTVGPFVHGG